MSRRAPGEGSIVQRSNRLWQGSLQVEGRRATVYGKTRSEVAEKLRATQDLARRNAGRLPSGDKTPLSDFLADWLEQAKPHLRPRTWDRYEGVIRLHLAPALGKTTLKKLTPLRLGQHYSALAKTCGPRTVQMAHRILHRALADALRWGLVATNVATLVDAPRAEPREAVVWQPDHIARFLGAMQTGIGNQYGNLFTFLLASGCREGEALGLRWADVDWTAGSVRIERQVTWVKGGLVESPPKSKTGRRTLVLPGWGLEALRRQRAWVAERRLALGPAWQGAERVFVSERGTPPTKWNVWRAFRANCGKLGLPALPVHGLRHLHLSMLAMNGVPLKAAQARAGHSDPMLTARVYQHILGDADRQAARAIEQAVDW